MSYKVVFYVVYILTKRVPAVFIHKYQDTVSLFSNFENTGFSHLQQKESLTLRPSSGKAKRKALCDTQKNAPAAVCHSFRGVYV